MNQTYKFKPSLFQRKKNSFEYEQSLQKVIRFQIIPRLLSSHLKVCSRHVGNSYQSGLKITGFEISEFINLCITDNEQLSKDYIKRLISYGISTDQIFLELITPTARLLGEKWDEDLLDFTQVTHGLVRLHSITHDIGFEYQDGPTFIAINGYYMEKSWSSEKNALNMELIAAKKINTLSQELINADHLNSELSIVLLEKNRLLTSLSSSIKSSRAGIMASSFVHEINQSLTTARLNAEFLLAVADKPPDENFIKSNLNYLINDIDKISVIITNVKRVFHNNHTDFKDVSLASIVESGVELVKDECELKNIDLSFNVDSQLIVSGNQSQLEMVVLNLLNNAIDSLDAYDGKRLIAIASSQVDGNIHLSFEDSGMGVPLELQEKIFDLFRTTKNDGMGFGLWLSRAVMDNHRGSLSLDKDYSDGARFVVEFRLSNNSQ